MMYISELQTGSTYLISYTNADGESSKREITIHRQWYNYGHDYIKAYCGLAEEDRTFRLDRIESAVKLTASDDCIHEHAKRRGAGHPFLVFLSIVFVVFMLFIGFADNKGSSYTAPEKPAAVPERAKPLRVKTPEWERNIQTRKDYYSISTGFKDRSLLDIYASADTNYDNILSWQEISWFQNRIKNKFSYQSNNTFSVCMHS